MCTTVVLYCVVHVYYCYVLHITYYRQVRCLAKGSAGIGGREEMCFIKGSVESVLEHCVFFHGGDDYNNNYSNNYHKSVSYKDAPVDMGQHERRRVLNAASALGSKGRR